MRGLCRSKPSPTASYLLAGAGWVASARFHLQAFVPEDQDLLGMLHVLVLGLSGKGVPVVCRPLHVSPERPLLEVGPSLSPQQHPFAGACISQGPSLPLTILPSYWDKLMQPSMKGGDGGKKPGKEDGTPNYASSCKITQAITE